MEWAAGVEGGIDVKNPLREKEVRFCRLMAEACAPTEAAARAGYLSPARAADRLLARQEIRTAIGQESEALLKRNTAAGYSRLAFGSVADAVRLCFADGVPEDLDSLDLYAVSELKCTKNGVEIKFHDRLKALDRLCELASPDADPAEPFYRALELGARRLTEGK